MGWSPEDRWSPLNAVTVSYLEGLERGCGACCSSWFLPQLLICVQLDQESGKPLDCGKGSLLLLYDNQMILMMNDNTCEPQLLHFRPVYSAPRLSPGGP